MNEKLQNQLYEKYPKLFCQKDLPMTHTCMCWGVAVGDGWYDIIDNLCDLIQQRVKQPHENIEMYESWVAKEEDLSLIENWKKRIEEEKNKIISVEFTQIKEKFGTLRIYHNSDDPYIDGLISMAESMSGSVCEKCGNKGYMNTKGWISTLCEPCRESRFSDK